MRGAPDERHAEGMSRTVNLKDREFQSASIIPKLRIPYEYIFLILVSE